jgi:hypothetical protein
MSFARHCHGYPYHAATFRIIPGGEEFLYYTLFERFLGNQSAEGSFSNPFNLSSFEK